MGRKENKETNTHTPMPRHAQKKKKKKKQEQRKEKQYCPRSERLDQPHSRSSTTGSWLSQLGINTKNTASMS